MGVYKYLQKAWKSPSKEATKERVVQWRKEPSTLRIHRPTRLDRARSLGYKAKQGIFVVRQSIPRGGHTRPGAVKGRRPKTQRRSLVLRKNYRQLCEERTSRKFPNCEVLNSYYVGKDGQTYWYEIIMVDGAHPRILSDPNLANLAAQKGRAHRGLTSAGRKGRGLHHKGKGVEKARPSRRAHDRKQ
jgi:large subunit ribosomal protein L15e